MGNRLGASLIGLAVVAAGIAGCSSTTADSSGAVQDVATAAASSAPASTCAEGGVCEIGDTGPAGGIVFYVATTPFTTQGAACGANCSYLEAQPSDLEPAVWCTGPGAAKNYNVMATGTAIGTGYTNTQGMNGTYTSPSADVCTGGAGNEAAAPWGGYSDWFLPSVDELFALLSVPASATGVLTSNADGYWSSTYTSKNLACALAVPVVLANESCPNPELANPIDYTQNVRAIRAF